MEQDPATGADLTRVVLCPGGVGLRAADVAASLGAPVSRESDGTADNVDVFMAALMVHAGWEGVAAPQDDGPAESDFVHYASARRLARQQEQEALVAMILHGAQPSDQTGVGSRLTSSIFTTEMLKMLSDSRES